MSRYLDHHTTYPGVGDFRDQVVAEMKSAASRLRLKSLDDLRHALLDEAALLAHRVRTNQPVGALDALIAIAALCEAGVYTLRDQVPAFREFVSAAREGRA